MKFSKSMEKSFFPLPTLATQGGFVAFFKKFFFSHTVTTHRQEIVAF